MADMPELFYNGKHYGACGHGTLRVTTVNGGSLLIT